MSITLSRFQAAVELFLPRPITSLRKESVPLNRHMEPLARLFSEQCFQVRPPERFYEKLSSDNYSCEGRLLRLIPRETTSYF